MKKDYQARLEEISARDRSIWASGMFFAGMDEFLQAGRSDGVFQCPADLRFADKIMDHFIGQQHLLDTCIRNFHSLCSTADAKL